MAYKCTNGHVSEEKPADGKCPICGNELAEESTENQSAGNN